MFKHTKHIYKGYVIRKIWDCGMDTYTVTNADEEFKRQYWDGEFARLKDAKKAIDEYMKEEEK